MTRKFPKDKLLEILWDEEDAEGKVVRDRIVDNDRWTIVHDLIFSWNDKLWRTGYRVEATEYQNEGPWEYDQEVKCTEVREVQKVVTDYEEVKP